MKNLVLISTLLFLLCSCKREPELSLPDNTSIELNNLSLEDSITNDISKVKRSNCVDCNIPIPAPGEDGQSVGCNSGSVRFNYGPVRTQVVYKRDDNTGLLQVEYAKSSFNPNFVGGNVAVKHSSAFISYNQQASVIIVTLTGNIERRLPKPSDEGSYSEQEPYSYRIEIDACNGIANQS